MMIRRSLLAPADHLFWGFAFVFGALLCEAVAFQAIPTRANPESTQYPAGKGTRLCSGASTQAGFNSARRLGEP
jgi:hypothetical protein